MNLSWGRGGLQEGGLQRGRTHSGAGKLSEEVGWEFGLPVAINGELELGKRWAPWRWAPESKNTFRSWRTWCGGGLGGWAPRGGTSTNWRTWIAVWVMEKRSTVVGVPEVKMHLPIDDPWILKFGLCLT